MAEVKKVTKTIKPEAKAKKVVKKPVTKEAVVKVSKATRASATDRAKQTLEPKDAEISTAKAGKRSNKALKEAEEKQVKAERKAKVTQTAPDEEKPEKPKTIIKRHVRSRLERRGKKFRQAAELIVPNKAYDSQEASVLAIKTNQSKFDATVEIHVNLGVDPKQADQNIRNMVVLPFGSGKTLRVAVMAEATAATAALKAGAEIAGVDEVLELLNKETLSFDVLIATPTQMPKLGKFARLLGPKGLMPNPKSGTVTTDVAKAVREAKAGKVEYRVDGAGIIHLGVGKVSFGEAKLEQNVNAVLSSIQAVKPASVKGIYIKSVYLTTSMGPSIRLALSTTA
jgi:large subunit ribosomal protein L1